MTVKILEFLGLSFGMFRTPVSGLNFVFQGLVQRKKATFTREKREEL